jgi:hypothetical protein
LPEELIFGLFKFGFDIVDGKTRGIGHDGS